MSHSAPSRWPSNRHQWVTTPDGVDISVREWGNPRGRPILFVHGLAQSHLSFLPQFVNASAGSVAWQVVLLGALFMVQTAVIFGAVAIFSGWIGERLRARPAIAGRLGLFAGLTFIALGIRVAMPDMGRP